MVHLNGRFPIGYDDDTLAAIQGSGGGAVGSLDEALTRLMAGREETATSTKLSANVDIEDIGETTLEPVPVTGVPEPEEWLLIGLSAIMLIWYVRRNQLNLVPNSGRVQGN